MPRVKKFSFKKYFQTRTSCLDTRFAGNVEYIFDHQYRCEIKEIQDSLTLSVALRKGEQNDLTAVEIRDNIKDY